MSEAEFNSGIYVLIEAAVVIGLALVIGVKELRNLRRYDRERAARNKAKADGAEDGQS